MNSIYRWSILVIILGFSFQMFLGNIPIYVIVDLAVIIIGIQLSKDLGILNSKNQKTVKSKEDINNQISSILDSNDFLTAINEALPKGNKDSEYGIDYIPYMLKSINERHKRYLKSSKVFLFYTIFVGIIFSAIVMSFGYILVDESSVGKPKLLKDIQIELEEVKEISKILLPNFFQSELYFNGIGGSINKLEVYDFNDNNASYYKEILESVTKLKSSGDFNGFTNKLSNVRKKMLVDKGRDDAFLELISETNKGVQKYVLSKSAAEPRLSSTLLKLENQINNISKIQNLPDSRQVELIKRLAIGFIVSSFFLAILKYIAGLYRENHRQMLIAERDELKIRQFYVAFKGISDSAEGRKELMLKYFNVDPEIGDNNKTKVSISKEEAGVLKEIISVLSKKI